MEKIKYLKILPFENIKNARSLGGYPTYDGKITSWDSFIRSANLDSLTENDMALLKDLNVSTIIDLRREEETKNNGEKIEIIKNNFTYKQISLMPLPMKQEDIQKIIERKISIGNSYISLIDNFSAIKEILEILAFADGSVLYHCQEGKDRTGIISMILLLIANSPREIIMADYEVSSANLGYIDMFKAEEAESIFRITSPYNIKEAMDYIISKYKNIEFYLEKVGIDNKTLKKLKEKMIE
ncbi:tyrosine-protein phosphatase [Anaerococcus senegalensis]|uniref:tyrosine-protein phosphatase n=1 Tax=Anaerococcus senegalensis TaxID=1288120 RepID=UPI00031A6819|nr:tyrosine-protein phosphatase [Anaerococcus senegalensis]